MIFITGSKGQLGRALAGLLDSQGRTFRGCDLDELDIGDFPAVRNAIRSLRPRLVVNAAAYTDVDGAEENWQLACRVNALAVRNLAVACAEEKIPLVHVGTDFVFDGEADRPYRLCDLPRPINVYGQTKLLGEQLLTTLTDRYYLVRTSWVFGRGPSNFLAKLLTWSAGKDVLKVVTDQVSSPTAAGDLAALLLKLAETEAYGLYHFHNPGQCSRFEWADHLLKKRGWTGRLEPVTSDAFPLPARRPAYSVLDLYPLEEMDLLTGVPDWRDATTQWMEELK